jgi:hypothetical protein
VDTIPVNATILSGSTILVFVAALALVYAVPIETTVKVTLKMVSPKSCFLIDIYFA